MARSKAYTQHINSPEWKRKSRQAVRRFRCCLFPWLAARHSHHLTYRNMGQELFWRDYLPLSKSAHSVVHHPWLWHRSKPSHPIRIGVNYYLRWVGFPLSILATLWVLVMEFLVSALGGNRKRRSKKRR